MNSVFKNITSFCQHHDHVCKPKHLTTIVLTFLMADLDCGQQPDRPHEITEISSSPCNDIRSGILLSCPSVHIGRLKENNQLYYYS